VVLRGVSLEAALLLLLYGVELIEGHGVDVNSAGRAGVVGVGGAHGARGSEKKKLKQLIKKKLAKHAPPRTLNIPAQHREFIYLLTLFSPVQNFPCFGQ